jgi:hypothetical protein
MAVILPGNEEEDEHETAQRPDVVIKNLRAVHDRCNIIALGLCK